MSPLAARVLDPTAAISPLCATKVSQPLSEESSEHTARAMYADSVRRKRKHKMNKHKHRSVHTSPE